MKKYLKIEVSQTRLKAISQIICRITENWPICKNKKPL